MFSAVGIPLTVLQICLHPDLPMAPWDVAANFAVAHAVYDADRQATPAPSTRLAAAAGATYYLADPATAPLAPVVPILNLGYRLLKPWLAPCKPFFVAALWTACVYSVPLLRHRGVWCEDVATPAALFLSLAALSHAADISDVAEDRAAGVHTPAVAMGEAEAGAYAITLGLAAALLHSHSPHPNVVYDLAHMAALGAILAKKERLAIALGVAYTAAYVDTHDVEVITALLRSTEWSHKSAIAFGTAAVEHAFTLDEPWRSRIADAVLRAIRAGDGGGAALLQWYEDAIRDRLG